MWNNRSIQLRPVRFARLSCEILDGRFLLSAGLLGTLSDAATGVVQPGQYSLLVTDLTGDGQNNTITASEDSNNVSVDLSGPNPDPAAVAQTASLFESTSLGRQTTTPVVPTTKAIQFTIPTPSAVTLGDLTGNGIDDMIVCDKSQDRVFIYLGLGGGRFGPEVNGGTGVFTGDSPDAVAMMPGQDGSGSEVLVANAGSNDVAIFQVEDTPSGCNLVLKGRAQVGPDPTSVLVQDLSGQGTPDLVVTNAGDNTVSILPGTSNGLFDDRAARILPTGEEPVQAVVGNFDGRPDLVTVDRGSNDVTFFSGVDSPNPVAKRIPTGGIEPVAAVAADVTGNGQTDLIVANYGDSRLTLLTGTSNGLQMSQSIQETGLHPAALATAAGLPAGSFYVLNAEQSTPTVMQFNVSETSPVSLTSDTETSTASGRLPMEEEAARTADWLVPSRVVGTDLQALTPSAVAVVPGVALRADVPHPAAGSSALPGGTAEDNTAPPPAPGRERHVCLTGGGRACRRAAVHFGGGRGAAAPNRTGRRQHHEHRVRVGAGPASGRAADRSRLTVAAVAPVAALGREHGCQWREQRGAAGLRHGGPPGGENGGSADGDGRGAGVARAGEGGEGVRGYRRGSETDQP